MGVFVPVLLHGADYVFICIQSGDVRSDHKWSLKTHVEMHSNARCEQTYLKLSACDAITQDAC